MSTGPATDPQQADAEQVDTALAALFGGDLTTAEQLLLEVVSRTPRECPLCTEDADGLSIRFWDEAAFIHYVMWQRKHGTSRSVVWIPNAYPRAYYYLGFLSVKRRKFEQAIEYLDRGLGLEPTNPKFLFEKAHALIGAGRKAEALDLYGRVGEAGPWVSTHDLGAAHRGRGFALIEMERLDEAETAFVTSLQFAPDNEIALNELAYIDHLRGGGGAARTESVPSQAANLRQCAVCGSEFGKGVIVSLRGQPVSICEKCRRKLTKKWWQFWK